MPIEEPPPETQDRLDRLINLATALNAEVDALARNSGKQFVTLAQTARRNRHMIIAMAASLVLDVVITVVLAVTGIGMAQNTNRIDDLTQQLGMAQTVQRQKALCPLYQLLKDSESPEGRAASEDKQQYDKSFKVINDGYAALECSQFLITTKSGAQ